MVHYLKGNTDGIHETLTAWGHKLSITLMISLLALPALAQDPDPTPNTYVDWPVPNLTEWNDVNVRTIIDTSSGAPTVNTRHTQFVRTLGVDAPADVSYIYPDAAIRDADIDGLGTGSVAFITWDLDDGSGRAPGMKVVTDDFAFPTNNCIMASGERESTLFPGTVVPKTCSDAQGSSKRFFLRVTEADAPIDLAFDTGTKILRYKGVRDPTEDGGEDLEAFREEFGIGRIYRVVGKFLNLTGKRIVSLKLEVGTGVGADFQPLSFDTDGIGFELRRLVPREFLEGETGAPDVAVWNPNDFATLSPKLFDDGVRPRFDPGFFGITSAGLNPPQLTELAEQSQFIDSGTAIVNTGILGAMTPNAFDVPANQGAGAVPPLVGTVFGYHLPESKAPYVIARHDDGNGESESDAIMAWWDGYNYRYGQAGDGDLGVVGPFGIVPQSELQQWAALPVGLDAGLTPDPARYEFLLSDDLANLNFDAFIQINENILDSIDGLGQPKFENITLRLVAKSVDSLGLGDITGSADPEWVTPGNEAPPLTDYMPATGIPVAINDLAVTEKDDGVSINVLANDLLDGGLVNPNVATVTIFDAASNGVATADNITSTRPVTYTPALGFVGDDSFTYTVEINGQVSNLATVKVTVNPPLIPDAPVAVNDSAVTFGHVPVSIDVLANDTLSGGPIPPEAIIEIIDQPVFGIATATVSDGQVIYNPLSTPEGTVDVFTYRTSVAGVVSNVALVIVRVDEAPEVIFSDSFE